MESFIVAVMRAVVRVGVIAVPIAGFIGGGLSPAAREGSGTAFNLLAAAVGACAGLFIAVIFFGAIAILLKIEANTRPKP